MVLILNAFLFLIFTLKTTNHQSWTVEQACLSYYVKINNSCKFVSYSDRKDKGY